MEISSPITSNVTSDRNITSTTAFTTVKNWTPHPAITTTHRFTIKDETVLVTLIVMGVIVPAVFIFVFVAICLKRRKTVQQRRNEMLLRDTQDFQMEDLPYSRRVELAAGRI